MIINHNKETNQVEINDNYKHLFLYQAIFYGYLSLSPIESIISYYKGTTDLFDYVWLILGPLTLLYLIYHLYKKSRKMSYIPNEITRFVHKKYFWGNHCFFELTNGKRRYFPTLTWIGNIEDSKQLFQELGIEVNSPGSSVKISHL